MFKYILLRGWKRWKIYSNGNHERALTYFEFDEYLNK